MFAPRAKLLHKQLVITQITHNYLTIVINKILCITHTQYKTKNLVWNNSNLIVTQKQLGRLLVIHKIESVATTQESKHKT
jgi:hypothetical protein